MDTVSVPGFAITHDQYLKKFLVKASFQLHHKPRSISELVLFYFTLGWNGKRKKIKIVYN